MASLHPTTAVGKYSSAIVLLRRLDSAHSLAAHTSPTFLVNPPWQMSGAEPAIAWYQGKPLEDAAVATDRRL
jgi:hypothetical protein